MARHLRAPLRADLRSFVQADSHAGRDGCYLVRSLYLDSPDWVCFFDKTSGTANRLKLRIRAYPDEGACGRIKFEIKVRHGQRIAKETACVDRAAYDELRHAIQAIASFRGALLQENPALRTFFRLKHLHAMAPVVNVQFRREAFHARGDRHVRITLDDALTACRARDLFDPMPPSRPLLDRFECVLEVKVESTLPFWLQRLIAKYRLQLAAFSKYAGAVGNGSYGLEGTY